jgi:hypothetical protein
VNGHRLTDAALRCYPGWWHELYADEVAQLTDDLLAEGRRAPRLAANLLRGALSVRGGARAMPPRTDLWLARARASIAVATLPFLGVLPFVFFGLQANEGYRTLPRAQVLRLMRSQSSRVTANMDNLLHSLVVIGLIAALVGWLALADGVRWSRVVEPSRPRLLLRLPLIILAVLFGLYIGRVSELPHGIGGVPGSPGLLVMHGGNPDVAAVLLDAAWVVLAAGSAVTVLAVARVAKVCEVPWRTMRSGRRVAAVTAAVLGVMALCAVVGMVVAGPRGFVARTMGVGAGDPRAPVTTYMVFPHWALVAVPLMIAAAASFAGWHAARRASRMLRTLDPRIGITTVSL